MDETDRVAAATIVASLITAKHSRFVLPDTGPMWPMLAKACLDIAQALADERQSRQLNAGNR